MSKIVPFVGLRSFDTADAQWFFGRDVEASALAGLLRERRFTAVIGPSGSGKSSVVRAGVIPGMRAAGWREIIVTPGSAPLKTLARSLADADDDDRLKDARRFRFDAMLRASAYGLTEIIETIPAKSTPLLLLVDQFEELFRYGHDATGTIRVGKREEARAFIELLLAAAGNTALPVHICMTMRSDYFGACSAYVGLAEAVSTSQFLIPLPQRAQLEDAIRKPVDRAGASIEQGLVQRLLVDVAEEQDQLPLLQHTLRRLWELASGEPRTMREESYSAVGRIAGSIDKRAEDVVVKLAKANAFDGTALECVMKALTDLDERGRATRHQQTRRELLALVVERGVPEPEKSLDRILVSLRSEDTSFLRIGDDEDPLVDIGHEALIRSWTRLSGPKRDFAEGWLREERNDGELWREYVRRATQGGVLESRELSSLLTWLSRRRFGRVWSNRYGDRWDEVQALKKRSQNNKRKKLSFALIGGAIWTIIVGGALAVGYNSHWKNIANYNFQQTIKSAQNLLSSLKKSLDEGTINSSGAQNMLAVAREMVKGVNERESTLETRKVLVIFENTVAHIYYSTGFYGQSEIYANKAKDHVKAILATNENDPDLQVLSYESIGCVGDALSKRNDYEGALVQYREAETLAEKLLKLAPADKQRLIDLLFIRQKMGDVLVDQKKFDFALTEYNKALVPIDDGLRDSPGDLDWRRHLANTRSRIGEAHLKKGEFSQEARIKAAEFSEAEFQFRDALKTRDDLSKETQTKNPIIESNRAASHVSLARLFAQQTQFASAVAEYGDAIAIQLALMQGDDHNLMWKAILASSYTSLGRVFGNQGDLPRAERSFRDALELRRQIAVMDRASPSRQVELALAVKSLADNLETQGKDLGEALNLYNEVIRIFDEAIPRPNDAVASDTKSMTDSHMNDLIDAHLKSGDILLAQGKREEASKEYLISVANGRDVAIRMSTAKQTREAIDEYTVMLERAKEFAVKFPESEQWSAFVESLETKLKSLTKDGPE